MKIPFVKMTSLLLLRNLDFSKEFLLEMNWPLQEEPTLWEPNNQLEEASHIDRGGSSFRGFSEARVPVIDRASNATNLNIKSRERRVSYV